MTELKSLKNLEKDFEDLGDTFITGKGKYYKKEELKAEAVKWVKANIIEREKYTYEDRSEFTGLIDGFIKFFNLTEEDLK